MRTFVKSVSISIARLLVPNLIRRLEQLNDWAQLGVYQTENQKLAPSASTEVRIVFFGDSITEFWDLTGAFPGRSYINRGIAGQTTAQMVVRFRSDVISLNPKAVLILAGINDIAGNTGPMTLEMIEGNYASIAELARINDIGIIFASVLPVHNYRGIQQTEMRSPNQIRALNDWLRCYCVAHNHIYLDYYSHLVDGQGMLRAEFSEDGVHPNAEGYKVMASLADAAIKQALQLIPIG